MAVLELLNKLAKTPKFIKEFYDNISDYEILKFYLGDSFSLNNKISSANILRERDDNPSLIFFRPQRLNVFEEEIYFKDMSTNVKGDTLVFMSHFFYYKFNVRYSKRQLVEIISNDMGLGLYNGAARTYERINYTLPSKNYKDIKVVTRNFTASDKAYWSKFTNNKLYLLDFYNVQSVKQIINVTDDRILKNVGSKELCFNYQIYDKTNVYLPNNPKGSKFIKTAPHDNFMYYQGYAQLKHYNDDNNKLLITKSMKDIISFKSMSIDCNFNLDLLATNAESVFFDKKFLAWLCDKYDDILVVGDFDYM